MKTHINCYRMWLLIRVHAVQSHGMPENVPSHLTESVYTVSVYYSAVFDTLTGSKMGMFKFLNKYSKAKMSYFKVNMVPVT